MDVKWNSVRTDPQLGPTIWKRERLGIVLSITLHVFHTTQGWATSITSLKESSWDITR
jgi:hypothetical protein